MGGCKRNCWTCGWDDEGDCFILENQADGWPGCEAWVEATDWVARYPPRDSDGCPGWKPKPGAENTDRAQVAALADSATIRPDSATGWRGHLPICRGPGGIAARRLRALVRGVR